MNHHKSGAAWLVGIGCVLLVLGVWLATITMKRHERSRNHSHFGPGVAQKVTR